MSSQDNERTVSTTLRVGPPKYQATIPQNVRDILEIEDQTVILEADLKVAKVVKEKDNQ